jgi:hypothetical protein
MTQKMEISYCHKRVEYFYLAPQRPVNAVKMFQSLHPY